MPLALGLVCLWVNLASRVQTVPPAELAAATAALTAMREWVQAHKRTVCTTGQIVTAGVQFLAAVAEGAVSPENTAPTQAPPEPAQ